MLWDTRSLILSQMLVHRGQQKPVLVVHVAQKSHGNVVRTVVLPCILNAARKVGRSGDLNDALKVNQLFRELFEQLGVIAYKLIDDADGTCIQQSPCDLHRVALQRVTRVRAWLSPKLVHANDILEVTLDQQLHVASCVSRPRLGIDNQRRVGKHRHGTNASQVRQQPLFIILCDDYILRPKRDQRRGVLASQDETEL